jgi:ubiquinone/menaquinone biosynthesis C-methylase UbiE
MPSEQYLPLYSYIHKFRPTTYRSPYLSLSKEIQMKTLTVTQNETDALTTRTRATWMAGDFGRIAVSYAPGAAEFINRLSLGHGDRVLDVACGTGNLSIPAARTGANVTGIDIAPNLLEQAEHWATQEGLSIKFEEGNAEQLPYENSSFDVVVSMFGAMFAPRATETAAELLRVTRPGGRIALANWTPDSFIGQMFRLVGKYVPPAPGVPSPLLWGSTTTITERFGDQVAQLHTTPRMITFNFPFDPAATVECFRTYYGPTVRAFDSLSDEDQRSLRSELEQHWSQHNRATDGTTQVDSIYLEVIAVRK